MCIVSSLFIQSVPYVCSEIFMCTVNSLCDHMDVAGFECGILALVVSNYF